MASRCAGGGGSSARRAAHLGVLTYECQRCAPLGRMPACTRAAAHTNNSSKQPDGVVRHPQRWQSPAAPGPTLGYKPWSPRHALSRGLLHAARTRLPVAVGNEVVGVAACHHTVRLEIQICDKEEARVSSARGCPPQQACQAGQQPTPTLALTRHHVRVILFKQRDLEEGVMHVLLFGQRLIVGKHERVHVSRHFVQHLLQVRAGGVGESATL